MPTYLQDLASYLPMIIRQQLRESPAPLTAPRSENMTGAFLFGDITGFTPLVERLAQKGSGGVEELSRLLNAYFHQLITLVNAHGGDVLRFAGDAVLALWPTDDEPLPEVVQRAAQCALAIQKELNNYYTFDGAELSMRIGIGAGHLSLVQLGGMFGRWEAMLTGAPIVQASRAEESCQPGQVIISPEAWALAQDVLEIEVVRKQGRQGLRILSLSKSIPPRPIYPVPLPADAELAARCYVPGAILQRLSAGQTNFLSELRRISVIFVNLPDFETVTDLDQAQRMVQSLQRALYHYEGSVNQLIMDDKGTTLVAALGLPPFAHEDDPSRGALAALELQSVLRELGQRFAIGVTTGHVYCGERGNSERREYAMLGDPVNLSARLMQAVLRAGGNQVWCDMATWQAAQTRLDFEALLPVRVKGKLDPIPVYRPIAEKHGLLISEVEPIGRPAERDRLGSALQSLLRAEPKSPLIIEGEPGLGKTRMVAEIYRQARATGLRVLAGSGDAIERRMAHHAWRGVLRGIFNLNLADPSSIQRQKVLSMLSDHLREQASLLNPILLTDFPEPEAVTRLSDQDRIEKLYEMVTWLLRKVSMQRPIIVILEDAHWFDTPSWSLSLAVNQLSLQMPLLLVLTTRPMTEHLPPEYIQLLELSGRQMIRLMPFSEAEIGALISQRLGTERASEALSRLIHQRTDGNPFFAEEMALNLRDAGALHITPAECRLAPGILLENIILPDTAQGLVSNRIDRLSPQEQMTLKVASVLGREFNFLLLQAVYPLEADRDQLDACLQTLIKQDFIYAVSAGDYSFKHTMTREAIYNQMLFSQRRQLHRAVADWYEKTYADDLSPYYPMLAHHRRLALDRLNLDPLEVEQTLEYISLAGERASSRLLYLEAIEFFSHALTLLDQLPPRLAGDIPLSRQLHWRRQLGVAHVNLGQLAEGRHQLEMVATLAGYPVPDKNPKLAIQLVIQVFWQAAHRFFPPSGPTILSAPMTEQDIRIQEATWALLWLFQPYVYDNRFLQAVCASLFAINLAESTPFAPPIFSTAYSMLSFYASALAWRPVADYYERMARQDNTQTSHPTLQTALELMLVTRAVGEGNWDEIRQILDRTMPILHQAGDYRQRGTLMNIQGFMQYFQSQYYPSLKTYRQIAQLGRASSNIEFQSWGWNGVSFNYLRQGHWNEARRALEEAERLMPSLPGSNLITILMHGMFARLALVSEEWDEALSHVKQIERFVLRTPFQFYSTVEALDVWVDVYRLQARRAGSMEAAFLLRSAERGCRELRKFAAAYPIGRPAALRQQGMLLAHDKKNSRARALFLQSLAEARKLRMPFDEALACWALSRLPDADLAEYRQNVRTHFQQIGALAYYEWLEKAG